MKKYENFLITLNENWISDKVDRGALQKVRLAQAQITTKFPFFTNLLFKLTIKETNDPKCKTMWTDGKSIGYNKDFVKRLGDTRKVAWVIIHEIMHNVSLHFLRMNGRDPELWNYAADYAINVLIDDLAKANPANLVTPDKVLLEEIYRDMSAEQIYNKIYGDIEKRRKELEEYLKGKSDGQDQKKKDDNFDNGFSDGQEQHKNDQDKNENRSDGKNKPKNKSDEYNDGYDSGYNSDLDDSPENNRPQQDDRNIGDKSDEYGEGFDDGYNGNSNKQNGSDGEGESGGSIKDMIDDFIKKHPNGLGSDIKKPGEVKGENIYNDDDGVDSNDKNISEEELAKQWVDHVKNAAKSYGSMTPGLDRIIKKIGEPKVNWKNEIQKFVNGIYKKRSLGYFKNRSIHRGDYLPGPKRLDSTSFKEVIIAIDTSASIGDKTLAKFASELKGLFKKYKIKKIHVIWCDSQIKSVQEFKNVDDSFNLDYLKPKGGGGTSFVPPFEWVEKNLISRGKTPAFMLYFTDAEGSAPNVGEYSLAKYNKRVLWVITDTLPDSKYVKDLSFGKKLFIDKIID